jgi:Rho-binding antiterminator
LQIFVRILGAEKKFEPNLGPDTGTIMNQPYIPISCAVHDELLALASFQKDCELTIAVSEGRVERIRGIIKDVYSREGAEYLQLRDGSTFRLDQILALNGRPIPPA